MKRDANIMINCLSQLRLRSQFILLISFLVFFIAGFLALWSFIHTQILSTIFIDGSSLAFQKQSEGQINQLTLMYSNFFQELFQQNGNNLISYQRFYRIAKQQVILHDLSLIDQYQMLYAGITPIPKSVRTVNQYGTNISYSFMCYSNLTAYNNPQTQIQKIEIKLQEQLQAIGQILYNGQLILQQNIYSYIKSGQSYSEYPCKNKGQGIKTYVPAKRSWYNALMKSYNETISSQEWVYKFSSPFISFTDQAVVLSITLPLLNDDLTFNGGIITNFQTNQNFSYLYNNVSQFHLVLLVSKNGTLLMHPYNINVTQMPVYIYNESITGFNITDWNEILSPIGISICGRISKTITCRYNSQKQQDLLISFYYFESFELYLIILLSWTEYNQFINEFNINLINSLNYKLSIDILYITILLLICYLFILLMTYCLFYPIDLIVKKAIQLLTKVNKDINLKFPLWIQNCMSEQMIHLKKCSQHIYQIFGFLSCQKTDECYKIESLSYPMQDKDILFKQCLRDIKSQSRQIKNNQNRQQFYTFLQYQVICKVKSIRKKFILLYRALE